MHGFTKNNVHVSSDQTCWNIKKLTVTNEGITMMKIRRSVTARLDNSTLEGFRSSLFCFKARITIAFIRMVRSEGINVRTAEIK